MKEVKYYACTVCGHISMDRADIVKCEETHEKTTSIIGMKYSQGMQFPYRITVCFADGSIFNYYNPSMAVNDNA